MSFLVTVGAGIAALFFASVVIVFLSSWVLGRSHRSYGAAAERYTRHEEFEELLDTSPPRSSYESEETTKPSLTDNSLIQEILSMELSDEAPVSAEESVAVEEEPPKNPLVSLIEEFDLSGDDEPVTEDATPAPEEDPLRELLGDDGEGFTPASFAPAEKESYTSYPECFGNQKDCNKSCSYAEECRRTVEILGEFI